jgi:hypothetical protein
MFNRTITRAPYRFSPGQRGMDPHPRQPTPMSLQKADIMCASPDWPTNRGGTASGSWLLSETAMCVLYLATATRLQTSSGRPPTRSAASPHLFSSMEWRGHRHQRQGGGQPDFEALQQRLRPREGKLPGHLCYMLFDCLYVNGHSLLNRPLEERLAILWELQYALQCEP